MGSQNTVYNRHVTYRHKGEFKKGYQLTPNIVNDVNYDLLVDFHNILNIQDNYFFSCSMYLGLGKFGRYQYIQLSH
jgi:hypothetical protein